jgi:hypothetical protein
VDPEPILREGDTDPNPRLEQGEAAKRSGVERADEAPLLEPKVVDRGDDSRHGAGRLEIDVDADLLGLFREECKRFVERRQVRANVPQGSQRAVAHGPACGTVTHLVEIVRVGDDKLAVIELDHVELDQVDPRLERRSKGAQRVLRRECGRTAVPDPERSSLAPNERDHGLVGR